jgi:hypothetical protein
MAANRRRSEQPGGSNPSAGLADWGTKLGFMATALTIVGGVGAGFMAYGDLRATVREQQRQIDECRAATRELADDFRSFRAALKNSEAYECGRQGGSYDAGSFQCALPEKPA